MSSDGIRIAKILDSAGPSLPQIEHRLEILKKWNIAPSSKILEIGCGQGDCTLVLADLVGDGGHVTAIDPAPLDYGAPVTLGEAQARLKSSSLGSRVTFHQTDLESFLKSSASKNTYDYAVFVHSVWYLSSPDCLKPMLVALRGRTKRLLIAEYVIDTRGDVAVLPHMLAVLSQAGLNSHTLDQNSNIQSIATPNMISELATDEGWQLEMDDTTEPSETLEDGKWEVSYVLSEGYSTKITSLPDGKHRTFANGLIEAVRTSRAALGPQSKLKTLPTWLSSWV